MPQVEEIDPGQALQILDDDARATLIDVRSRMEYDYVGHPLNAHHIAWAEPPDWIVKDDFVERVRRLLGGLYPGEDVEQLKVLAICRSGARSRAAGETLVAAGFSRVYNVSEGFEGDRDAARQRSSINGWRYRGLPWEQS